MQEAGQEDDVVELDQSPFAVAEMWAWVPGHVREEIFDHLDLRQATRLTRLSTSSAEDVRNIPKRNRGIGFLEHRPTTRLRFVAGRQDGKVNAIEWTKLCAAIPTSVPVSHLILVNEIKGIQYDQYRKCMSLTRMLPSLRKITLGEPFIGDVRMAARLWQPWWPFAELVIFRKWTLELSFSFNPGDASEQTKRIFKKESERHRYESFYMTKAVDRIPVELWGSFKFDCPNFEVPTKFSMIGEPMKRIWRLLDSQGMLWPYPEEQTQWLLRSLNSLRGKLLKTDKFLDRNWMDISHRNGSEDAHFALEKLNVTSKAACNRGQFNSLDLAFLGRLLVFSDKKVKIPGLEPPPFPFLTDLEFV